MLRTEGVAVDHRYGPQHAYRPGASAPGVIQRFHEPVELLLADGWQGVPAGTCLVTTACAALSHRAGGAAFSTDWMVVDGDLAAVAAKAGCPLATPIPGPPIDDWRALVDGLARECWRRLHGWEVVADHRLHDLLILLARSVRDEAPADLVVAGVRQRVMHEPERPWTIADMAAFAGLSCQRFSGRYRQAFGTSPLEDLLRVRIQLAQHLLRNTGLPIAVVAARCGFRDLPWFHRCFRRRTGRTPRTARSR